MRVLNRGADHAEEFNLFAQAERGRVNRDGAAFDELHGEIGDAVMRTAIEETRDVGMLQPGEDLAFLPETLADDIAIAPTGCDFQGDGFLVFVVIPDGFEYLPHAASPDLADDAIGAGPAAD